MIITISGQAGSGKSTVARMLAKRLGYKHYSIGDMRRQIALRMGKTLKELNKLGEERDFTDRDVDDFQRELGEKEDSFVIDGRLSFHFIPHSVKVYLKADLKTRAQRVLKDERKTEKLKDLEHAVRDLRIREKSDNKRYKIYYNLNCNDRKHYDLVIDTTKISARGVVERIMEFLERRGE